VIAACFYTTEAQGQFFKVYEYATPEAGAVELSYCTSAFPSSDLEQEFFGELLPREGLWAHSLEVEYGFSHKFTLGAYVDLFNPDGQGLQYAQSRLLARYSLFDKNSRPVDLALYGEYYLPSPDLAESEKLEIRLILEKDVGPIRLDFNPIFEKKTSGEEVEEGLEFGYAVGVYYHNADLGIFNTDTLWIRPGIELYGNVGELRDPRPSGDQRHYIFPVMDLYLPHLSDWYVHWNLGLGFGLTGGADNLVVKSIVSLEFLF
jgi:hypothetical protein